MEALHHLVQITWSDKAIIQEIAAARRLNQIAMNVALRVQRTRRRNEAMAPWRKVAPAFDVVHTACENHQR